MTQGYAAAAPLLTRALELSLALDVTDDDAGLRRWLAGGRAGAIVALELWDAESWHALAAVQAQFARDTGALVHLQYALNFLAMSHLFAGELTTAARLIDEDRLIAEVTGNRPVGYAAMALVAWQGQEAQASELIEATSRAATARGLGRMVSFADYASSVLYNGLGRHDIARDAAWRAFERDELGYGPYVVPELAEAASRTGDVALVRAALQWLSERTRAAPTEWALGIEARVRALLSEGDAAEPHYRESIDRLGRTRVRVQLARAHLLYGEWLRRERRRLDARATAAYRPRNAGRDGHRGIRRASPTRTAGHRRDRPQTHRRHQWRANRPRGRDRAACPRGAVEPGDRQPVVHQRAHGPVPPGQGLRQARHQLSRPARPGPSQRPGHRQAGVARRPAGVLVGAPLGQDWSVALTTGGCERWPLADANAGRRQRHLAGREHVSTSHCVDRRHHQQRRSS